MADTDLRQQIDSNLTGIEWDLKTLQQGMDMIRRLHQKKGATPRDDTSIAKGLVFVAESIAEEARQLRNNVKALAGE